MNQLTTFLILITQLLLTLLSSSNSVAQIVKQNKTYQWRYPEIRAVIIPFFRKDFDDPFTLVFSQAPFQIADTAQIAHNLMNHKLFNTTAGKILKAAEKTTKNVYAKLKENEIEDFKANTLHANVILIHPSIKSETLTKIKKKRRISLQGDLLVYDLLTGELIVRCSANSQTPLKGDTVDISSAVKNHAEELRTCLLSTIR